MRGPHRPLRADGSRPALGRAVRIARLRIGGGLSESRIEVIGRDETRRRDRRWGYLFFMLSEGASRGGCAGSGCREADGTGRNGTGGGVEGGGEAYRRQTFCGVGCVLVLICSVLGWVSVARRRQGAKDGPVDGRMDRSTRSSDRRSLSLGFGQPSQFFHLGIGESKQAGHVIGRSHVTCLVRRHPLAIARGPP